MKATITKIQRFSVHDGPGIRTTVFLKGCNMRCLWCHNPENLNKGVELGFLAQRCILCGECARVCPSMAIEIRDGVRSFDASKCSRCFKCEGVCVSSAITVYGAEYTPEELCEALLRDEKYYKKSGGGVTFSGGEPLLWSDFVFACADILHKNGITVAVESALDLPNSTVTDALAHIDLFMCDIKAIDRELHKSLTGVPNDRILENLKLLGRSGARILIRVPVAMGLNGTDENIKATALFMREAGINEVELLKLHKLALHKYESLGMKYPFPDIPETTDSDIEFFYRILNENL